MSYLKGVKGSKMHEIDTSHDEESEEGGEEDEEEQAEEEEEKEEEMDEEYVVDDEDDDLFQLNWHVPKQQRNNHKQLEILLLNMV